MESIGDARGFSGKTPITLSGDFSVETLTQPLPRRKPPSLQDPLPVLKQRHFFFFQFRWYHSNSVSLEPKMAYAAARDKSIPEEAESFPSSWDIWKSWIIVSSLVAGMVLLSFFLVGIGGDC